MRGKIAKPCEACLARHEPRERKKSRCKRCSLGPPSCTRMVFCNGHQGEGAGDDGVAVGDPPDRQTVSKIDGKHEASETARKGDTDDPTVRKHRRKHRESVPDKRMQMTQRRGKTERRINPMGQGA